MENFIRDCSLIIIAMSAFIIASHASSIEISLKAISRSMYQVEFAAQRFHP